LEAQQKVENALKELMDSGALGSIPSDLLSKMGMTPSDLKDGLGKLGKDLSELGDALSELNEFLEGKLQEMQGTGL